jgi:UDP-N-acetyl-D-mannosaminuronate dehydrogenase
MNGTLPATRRDPDRENGDERVPLLEAGSGLRVGQDLNAAFSPKRVDPGNKTYTLSNTPKVVGGITDRCTDRAVELYEKVCEQIVRVSSPEAAELTKLLENIFRSVNIAFAARDMSVDRRARSLIRLRTAGSRPVSITSVLGG